MNEFVMLEILGGTTGIEKRYIYRYTVVGTAVVFFIYIIIINAKDTLLLLLLLFFNIILFINSGCEAKGSQKSKLNHYTSQEPHEEKTGRKFQL